MLNTNNPQTIKIVRSALVDVAMPLQRLGNEVLKVVARTRRSSSGRLASRRSRSILSQRPRKLRR